MSFKQNNMDKSGYETLEIIKNAKWYNQWLFSLIENYVSGEILEIGCGIGNFTNFLVKKGNVVAIDINTEYIKIITKKYKNKVLGGFGDIEKGKYFFKNKKFDAIICFNVLEHIEDDKEALKNIRTLLKKGGVLILLVPAYQVLYSELDRVIGHFRRYTKKDLSNKLYLNGLKKQKIRYLNWWAAVGWYVFLKLTKWKAIPTKQVRVFDILGRFLLWPEKYIHPPFGLSVLAIARK